MKNLAEIYILQGDLPGVRELREHVWLNVGSESEAWSRKGERAKENIAGILLLQKALKESKIWNKNDSYYLRRTPEGRPFLSGSQADFNISHTEGIVVCALECEGSLPRVGVDAERLRGGMTDRIRRVAERWFTEGEREQLRLVESEETFLRIWTGKEALVKYTGEGISGLKKADTSGISPERGLCLTSYTLPNAILSICSLSELPGRTHHLHYLTPRELLPDVTVPAEPSV